MIDGWTREKFEKFDKWLQREFHSIKKQWNQPEIIIHDEDDFFASVAGDLVSYINRKNRQKPVITVIK